MSRTDDPTRTFWFRVARVIVTSFFRVTYRFRIVGADNIPSTGPLILASNHISNLDPPVIGICTHRHVQFMAKAELFKIRPIGAFLRWLGGFPVRRGLRDTTAVKYAVSVPKKGGCLVIFPEGHRSKDGRLGKGLTGVAFIARRAGCPIVPVAIVGPYRFRQPLTVRFGRPLLPEADDSNETLLEKLMSSIQELLNEGHA
ncbi:lysophospholipid acyltransferase family protein [Alicyclobacillus shizuokensis]|uniref:lysophospholipid acyltransferase family protein n=1 Tax=Alicyclobacillus shizuokensis TaxID=392014 RepID=UPI00083787BE|nr:lysophospholipid acyltransferase family protein [Alicyclobacillus shizuokensis]MCL6625050.1 1-acyl-sn-glycerol-3-phosphate acyltransferase [Alicyclobacillus shizuokensis]